MELIICTGLAFSTVRYCLASMAELKQPDSYELGDKQAGSAAYESREGGAVLSSSEWEDLNDVAKEGFTPDDQRDMQRMGKKQEFRVWEDYHLSKSRLTR